MSRMLEDCRADRHLDSGVVVPPACSLRNYGNASENYTVLMKIGDRLQSDGISGGHAVAVCYVTFPTGPC